MVESRDVASVPQSAHHDGPSSDALYKQGMGYYRHHEWHLALESFRDLKRLDPACREVDALLDELEIFIRLESCNAASPLPTIAPLSQPLRATLSRRSAWLIPAMAGIVVLALLLYGAISPSIARRLASLRERGQDRLARQEWSEAVNAYEELLLLAPNDAEARADLALVYQRRGAERAGQAESYEAERRYGEAAQQWELALADFRAAHDVDQDYPFDAADDPLARAATAEERRRCASRLDRATRLTADRRWSEAIQILQVVQREEPGYRVADVQAYLSGACLEAGLAAIAVADTAPQVRKSLDLLQQARDALPTSARAVAEVQRAQTYLQAVLGCEHREWGTAIADLEGLLQEDAGYAGGGARALLCRARMQRAGELYGEGKLQPALADYRAVWAAGCEQWDEARQQAVSLALALTPTAAPTTMPPMLVSSELSTTLVLTPATSHLLSTTP